MGGRKEGGHSGALRCRNPRIRVVEVETLARFSNCGLSDVAGVRGKIALREFQASNRIAKDASKVLDDSFVIRSCYATIMS
jgi:hypothetical protein